jgi:hypothetical protein
MAVPSMCLYNMKQYLFVIESANTELKDATRNPDVLDCFSLGIPQVFYCYEYYF